MERYVSIRGRKVSKWNRTVLLGFPHLASRRLKCPGKRFPEALRAADLFETVGSLET